MAVARDAGDWEQLAPRIVRVLAAPVGFVVAQIVWSAIPLPRGLPVEAGAAIATVLFLALAIATARSAARHLTTGRERAWLAALGVAIYLSGFGLVALGVPEPLPRAAMSCGLLCIAAAGGTAGASAIPDRNILIPAVLFMAAADFFVVHHGTVAIALRHPTGQRFLQALSLETAPPRPGMPPALVGLADILFLTFFYGCVTRFRLRERATTLLFFLIVGGTLWMVMLDRWGPVPGLVPMGLAFLVANWREFRLTRQEWGLTAGLVAGLAALYVAFIAWQRPAPAPLAVPPSGLREPTSPAERH